MELPLFLCLFHRIRFFSRTEKRSRYSFRRNTNLRRDLRSNALPPTYENQALCSSTLAFDLLLGVSRDASLRQRPILDFRFGGVHTGEVCPVRLQFMKTRRFARAQSCRLISSRFKSGTPAVTNAQSRTPEAGGYMQVRYAKSVGEQTLLTYRVLGSPEGGDMNTSRGNGYLSEP